MTPAELLIDAFDRIHESATAVLDDLTDEQLVARPADEANTVAWLIWHLTRVQDLDLASTSGREQVWTSDGYDDRFGLPFGADDHGYGHSPEQVGQVRVGGELLGSYLDAVHQATTAWLSGLTAEDLDDVVDTSYDPPVTLGVRLVSVLDDDAQHVGQAAYVRGLVTR